MDRDFSVGDMVEHKLYGIGPIIEIEGVGENSKITVNFRENNVKKLIKKYANLKKYDGEVEESNSMEKCPLCSKISSFNEDIEKYECETHGEFNKACPNCGYNENSSDMLECRSCGGWINDGEKITEEYHHNLEIKNTYDVCQNCNNNIYGDSCRIHYNTKEQTSQLYDSDAILDVCINCAEECIKKYLDEEGYINFVGCRNKIRKYYDEIYPGKNVSIRLINGYCSYYCGYTWKPGWLNSIRGGVQCNICDSIIGTNNFISHIKRLIDDLDDKYRKKTLDEVNEELKEYGGFQVTSTFQLYDKIESLKDNISRLESLR